MANEITLNVRLQCSKPSTLKIMDFNPGTLQFDMAGSNNDGPKIISVTTSAAAVPVSSDVGTEGYAFFRNLDTTNFLVLSTASDATTPLVKLKAGQLAIFPLATGAFYAKADTGTCRLQYGILEA